MCAAGAKAGLSQSQLDTMLQQITTEEIKEKLKQRTQEALDLGVRTVADSYLRGGGIFTRCYNVYLQ